MTEGSSGWYIRVRGRTLGPFTMPQLQSMRDRGQLSQFHEVSQDRRSWINAAGVPELFSKPVGERGEFPPASGADQGGYGWVEDAGASPGSTAAEAAPSWFFARGTAHQGPLYLADLQRMIDSGEIGPSTLVWKQGMASWVPAHQVSELRFSASAFVPAGSSGGLMPPPSQSNLIQPYAHQPPQMSGLAIASLVLGLLWLCGIGSLLATIFGAVALSQISRSNGTISGKGLAIAGLILGIVGLSLFALPFTRL